jgi:Flp pilus assembly protein TadG
MMPRKANVARATMSQRLSPARTTVPVGNAGWKVSRSADPYRDDRREATFRKRPWYLWFSQADPHLTMFRHNRRRPAGLGNRAVAALEFAVVAPVVVFFLAAASDYGLAWWSKGCLTTAVAQGAYYAFRTGPTVTTANLVTLVTGSSSLTGVTATASDPTACYCPTGITTSGTTTVAAALGPAVVCTTTCTDPYVSTVFLAPGNYLTITANYTLTGLFSLTGLITKGKQISVSATVRLQ